jgi:hypothetical protein
MPEFERLDEGLNRAGARDDCPMCGHNAWSPGGEHVLLQALSDNLDVNIGRGYLAYQLMCENCGFYRLHSVGTLNALTQDLEREEGTGNDEDATEEAG